MKKGKRKNDRQTGKIGSQNEEGKKRKNDRQTRRMRSQNEEKKKKERQRKDEMAKKAGIKS
jgi:hypothetical protein